MASKEASTSSTEHFIFFSEHSKKKKKPYLLLKFNYVTAGEMGLMSYPTSQNMLEKKATSWGCALKEMVG